MSDSAATHEMLRLLALKAKAHIDEAAPGSASDVPGVWEFLELGVEQSQEGFCVDSQSGELIDISWCSLCGAYKDATGDPDAEWQRACPKLDIKELEAELARNL